MTSARKLLVMGGVAATLAVAGCGDAVHRMLADPLTRGKVFAQIVADTALTREAADQLIGGETTRAELFDRVLANGPARQAMLIAVARDPMLLDGVLQFAVQDSSMRKHVMTLFKGMQIAGAK